MSIINRIEKKMLKVFDKDLGLSRPIKIIYTKIIPGLNIAYPSTTEEFIVKKDKELIYGFELEPTNDKGEIISTYDMELLIRDLKFDITSVAFSNGVFTSILGETLNINGTDLDLSEVGDLDGLLLKIDEIPNIFTFKTSDTEFTIVSSVADGENDLEFQPLVISGTAQSLLGLETNSDKAILKFRIDNIQYSSCSVFTGDYLKSVKLVRG